MTDLQPLPIPAPRKMPSPELLHDLRTPLNQIIGYSEILTELAEEEGQAGFVPDLQKIRAAGHQMLVLLNREGQAPPVEPLPDTPSGEPVEASSSAVSPAMLLVVDDDEMNRDMLSRRLERQGFRVATAENGRQAMAAVRSQPFDLVLLDIMMPEMDGYTVLQRLKADEYLCHIPVIMISALDELDSVVRCIEMGAEDYLPKPFNPILLKARIGACLEKKWAHDSEANLYQQLQQHYKRERHIAQALQRPLTLEIAEDTFPGLSVATVFEPASSTEAEIGGDFFDAFALPDGRVVLAVADASGKGLAAAARTMQVKDVLRAFARESPHVLEQIATRLNGYVCDTKRFEEGADSYESFVCLGLAIMDPETGETHILAAGAESPVILRASGEYEAVQTSGTALGVNPQTLYATTSACLGRGDTLILLTDGITEARRRGEFFGQEGLIEFARQGGAAAMTLRETGLFILNGARAFAGGMLRDDTCLLLAQRK